MNTTEKTPATDAVNLHTEQPVSASAAEEKDQSTNFYIVGGVINILMITAYFVWAFGAWRKAGKRKSGNDTAS